MYRLFSGNSTRLCSFWFATGLAFPVSAAEELPQLEFSELQTRVAEATSRVQEAVPSAVARGTFSRRVSSTKNTVARKEFVGRGTFSYAYQGNQSFLKLFFENPDAEFNAQIYLNDSQQAFRSSFSPRISRGAEGEILHLVDDSHVQFLYCPLPHAWSTSWTYLHKLEGKSVRIERKQHFYIVVAESPEGWQEKFTIDSEKDFLLTGFEIVMPEDRPLIWLQKDWAKTKDDHWYVRDLTYVNYPRFSRSAGEQWRFRLTTFEERSNLPKEMFTREALLLPTGARIIDRRNTPNETITEDRIPSFYEKLDDLVGPLPQPN